MVATLFEAFIGLPVQQVGKPVMLILDNALLYKAAQSMRKLLP